MKKIIVTNPAGEVEEIELGEGGYYLDAARVLWDEADGKAIPKAVKTALAASQAKAERQAVREQRNALLRAHVDAMGAMRWDGLDATKKAAWRAYRQALLDVPQQPGFPADVVWPVMPVEGV